MHPQSRVLAGPSRVDFPGTTGRSNSIWVGLTLLRYELTSTVKISNHCSNTWQRATERPVSVIAHDGRGTVKHLEAGAQEYRLKCCTSPESCQDDHHGTCCEASALETMPVDMDNNVAAPSRA
jgi:hypothetical protein